MNSDTISRAAAIDAINKALDRETLLNSFVRKVAVDAVKAMPSAQPSATDTNVGGNLSVDELITFLNPESNYVFYDDSHGFCINTQDVIDHLCAMPSAQLAQDLPNTCTDAIGRQAAIEAMRKAKDKSEAHRMLIQLPSAQPGWIPCKTALPTDFQWYYATCKSLVDNRENWVFEGCYTPWEHFNSTPMIRCGKAEVIAWMPKEIPEPWEGGQDGEN